MIHLCENTRRLNETQFCFGKNLRCLYEIQFRLGETVILAYLTFKTLVNIFLHLIHIFHKKRAHFCALFSTLFNS